MNFLKKVMTFFSVIWNTILWKRHVRDKKTKSADNTGEENDLLKGPRFPLEEDQGFVDVPLHFPEPIELETNVNKCLDLSVDDHLSELVSTTRTPTVIAGSPERFTPNVLALLHSVNPQVEEFNIAEAKREDPNGENLQSELTICLELDPPDEDCENHDVRIKERPTVGPLTNTCMMMNDTSCDSSEGKPMADIYAESVQMNELSEQLDRCIGDLQVGEYSSTIICDESTPADSPELKIDEAVDECVGLLGCRPARINFDMREEEVLSETPANGINEMKEEQDLLERETNESKMPSPLHSSTNEEVSIGERSKMLSSVSSLQLKRLDLILDAGSNPFESCSTNYMVKSDSLVNFLLQDSGEMQPELNEDKKDIQDDFTQHENNCGILEEIMCTSKGILKLSDDKIHSYKDDESNTSTCWVSKLEGTSLGTTIMEKLESYQPSFGIDDENDEADLQEVHLLDVDRSDVSPSFVVDNSNIGEDGASVVDYHSLALQIDEFASNVPVNRMDSCCNLGGQFDLEEFRSKPLGAIHEDGHMQTILADQHEAITPSHTLLPNFNVDGEYIPQEQNSFIPDCGEAFLAQNQSRIIKNDLLIKVHKPVQQLEEYQWRPTACYEGSIEQDPVQNVCYVTKNNSFFFAQKGDSAPQDALNMYADDAERQVSHPFVDCSSLLSRIPKEIRKYDHFNPCVGAPPLGKFLYGKNVDGETVRFEGSRLQKQFPFTKCDTSVEAITLQQEIGEELDRGRSEAYREIPNRIFDGCQLFDSGSSDWNTPGDVPAIEQRSDQFKYSGNFNDHNYQMVSYVDPGTVQGPALDDTQHQILNGYGYVHPYGSIVFPALNSPNMSFCRPQYPAYIPREPVPPHTVTTGSMDSRLNNQIDGDDQRLHYPSVQQSFWVGFQDQGPNEEGSERNSLHASNVIGSMEEYEYVDGEDDEEDLKECHDPDPYIRLSENTSLHTIKSKADSCTDGSLFCVSLKSILSQNIENERTPSISFDSVRCLNPSLALRSRENILSNDSLPSIIADDRNNRYVDEDYLATEKFKNDLNTALNESVIDQIPCHQSPVQSNTFGRGDGEVCGMEWMTEVQMELDLNETGELIASGNMPQARSLIRSPIGRDGTSGKRSDDREVDVARNLCSEILRSVIDNVVIVGTGREELSEFIGGLDQNGDVRQMLVDGSSQEGNEIVVVQHMTLESQVAPAWVHLSSGMVLDINNLGSQSQGQKPPVSVDADLDDKSSNTGMGSQQPLEEEASNDFTLEYEQVQSLIKLQDETPSKPRRNRRRKMKNPETYFEDMPIENKIGDGSQPKRQPVDQHNSLDQVGKEQEAEVPFDDPEEPSSSVMDTCNTNNNRKRRNRQKKRKN